MSISEDQQEINPALEDESDCLLTEGNKSVEPFSDATRRRDVWTEATNWAVPTLSLALQQAKTSRTLHLSYQNLQRIEEKLIKASFMSQLVRLDLAYNDLESIPREIEVLERLEQLWINDNPRLAEIPAELANCRRLKVIDARRTQVRNIPCQLGTLESLIAIDLRGTTTLKPKLVVSYVVPAENLPVSNNTQGDEEQVPTILAEIVSRTQNLKAYLIRRHETKVLRKRLLEKLSSGLYRDLSESDAGCRQIMALIKDINKEFQELDVFADVVRNCDRLLPDRIDCADVKRMRKQFDSLKRQNERKKLAAKLELRLRALYFDRINPTHVEGIVQSLYAEILELADVHFLIKFAPQIFPERVELIDAKQVFHDLKALQTRLAQEREEAVHGVFKAMMNLYSHVEPPLVQDAANKVCSPFKKIEELKKLAADASQYFPSEFEICVTHPMQVRALFLGEAETHLDL